MSGMPLLLSSGSMADYAYARYANSNTQSQANANECNTGTNCAITSPQTQGDGTANSPNNLQISKFNEEEQEGVGELPVGSGLLTLGTNCTSGTIGGRDTVTCNVLGSFTPPRVIGELQCYTSRGPEDRFVCFLSTSFGNELLLCDPLPNPGRPFLQSTMCFS